MVKQIRDFYDVMDDIGFLPDSPSRTVGIEIENASDTGVERGLNINASVSDVEAVRRSQIVPLHKI